MNGHLELDDIVEVFVENLEPWAENQNHDPNKLVPYINGRAIKANYPDEIHLERGRLIFHLQITPESRDPWIDLLGEPAATHRPVTFSIGPENGSAFDSVYLRDNMVPLTVISPLYGIIALLVILVTLILLLWLCRTTNIIREPGPPPVPGKHRPYNLGRAQMAFWFFLIYASYMTIWLITSALDTITASLLALMGISAGTALGEALIDNGKEQAKTNQVQDLTAQKQALEQTLTEVQPQVEAANTSVASSVTDQANRDSLNRQLVEGRTRLGQIDQQLRTIAADAPPTVSSGFLRDILSDGSGYSFHRFQIFAWTIVLGIIFVSSVYNDLTMPEFSPTLLGLMGLSAGTYIGFKFPEQK
jgi:outer membrane murein-binding lipoprotein Lpp